MNASYRIAGAFLAGMLLLAACKKYTDTPGPRTDPRFERKYCNVPDAVNYNWDFPGTPDSSDAVCFYPSDVFEGSFLYTDSIYSLANAFVREEVKMLRIAGTSRTTLTINGFCPATPINLTANRNLQADADSNTATGQLLCRPVDTLSGYVFTARGDSARLQFSFRVGSDTGVFFHRGSALKQ